MKRVAVLVFDLMIEYNITVVDGIEDYFKDKDDVQVIVSPVCVPENNQVFYDYQYWTAVTALSAQEIDAVIVVTNSFINYLSYEKLAKWLEPLYSKPIISIGGKLDIPGSKYTTISCDLAYEQIVEHLATQHNRKKIAFFSAELSHSPESDMRENAYKNALKKYNLEFHEDWIIPGDFTPGTAELKMGELFKTKEDIKFDAILCANDYTASGCLMGLYNLGLRVPDDVCVVGFDDTEIAVASYPTLTTINQDLKQIGVCAGEIVYKIFANEDVPECTYTQAVPIYRQSCGCISMDEMTSAYLSEDGEYKQDIRQFTKFGALAQSAQNLLNIYNLLGLMNTDNSLKEYVAMLSENMKLAKLEYLAVCFYDNPLVVNAEQPFEMPDNVKLAALIDLSKNDKDMTSSFENVNFDPRKNLLPEDIENKLEKDMYLYFPLFSKYLNYGYIICKNPSSNYNLLSIYLRILSNSLVNAYEMSREKQQKKILEQKNLNLNIQSKTDELTQIYNRRGFFDYGQSLIDLSVGMGKEGCVFFFDLDGLKKINDTYGHEIGDLAIKTEAKVLQTAFRDTDLVGRLSGDEFAAIAPGFDIENLAVLRERILKLNEEFSKKEKFPFTLSISVGPIEFDSTNTDLQKLLKAADNNLYDEKHKKHAIINK